MVLKINCIVLMIDMPKKRLAMPPIETVNIIDQSECIG